LLKYDTSSIHFYFKLNVWGPQGLVWVAQIWCFKFFLKFYVWVSKPSCLSWFRWYFTFQVFICFSNEMYENHICQFELIQIWIHFKCLIVFHVKCMRITRLNLSCLSLTFQMLTIFQVECMKTTRLNPSCFNFKQWIILHRCYWDNIYMIYSYSYCVPL
jgi:hypothetical protein